MTTPNYFNVQQPVSTGSVVLDPVAQYFATGEPFSLQTGSGYIQLPTTSTPSLPNYNPTYTPSPLNVLNGSSNFLSPNWTPSDVGMANVALGNRYLDLQKQNLGTQQLMGYLNLGANALGAIYGFAQGNKQLKLAQQALNNTNKFTSANLAMNRSNLIDRTTSKHIIDEGWQGNSQKIAEQNARAKAEALYPEKLIV